MKRFLLISCVLILTYTCKDEPSLPSDTYELTVTAPGVYNGIRTHITVQNSRNQTIVIDTAMFMKEQAVFTGKISNPVLRNLSINGVQGNFPFVLEPGISKINFNIENPDISSIEGGENNSLFTLFKNERKQLIEAYQAERLKATNVQNSNDTQRIHEITETSNAIRNQIDEHTYTFIEKHPDADISLLLLDSKLTDRNLSLEKLKSYVNLLDKVIKRSAPNKLIGQRIQTVIERKEALANLEVGKIAPEFTSLTADGKELSLSDVKGKATIVEFWASWCGPCRKENPNIVNVYNKYHDKGLEIIGISLDRENQKQRWLDAIEKDGLDWHHVSSLQYFNDPVARLYNVSAIPASFILDEDGRIVAKKLRGKALENQIASMLD